MELVVRVHHEAALEAALEVEAGGVALQVASRPERGWWSQVGKWRQAAGRQGVMFYLVWDELVGERQFPQALAHLEAAARLQPDGLALSDLGLLSEAQRRFSDLPLQAAAGWNCHNSLGLKAAEALGLSRVVLAAPLTLKELGLMRRFSSLPMQVVTPWACVGLPWFCRTRSAARLDCASVCPAAGEPESPLAVWQAALEKLPGMVQLGVEAVEIALGLADANSVRQVVSLFKQVLEAPGHNRPQVLAAARDVLLSLGEALALAPPGRLEGRAAGRTAPRLPQRQVMRTRGKTGEKPKKSRLWIEARGYAETAALARDWKDPLVVQLTTENYQAFLQEHRGPGHMPQLIWRLPQVLREETIPFVRQAAATLRQAGFTRFLAGNWGAVALLAEKDCEIFGDETLGVCNNMALKAGRRLGVSRFCLPPAAGPDDWEVLLHKAGPGVFWSYLLYVPVLAVCSPQKEGEGAAHRPRKAGRTGLRWLQEGGLACLCPKAPVSLEHLKEWLEYRGVSPLVAALLRTGLSWGRLPPGVVPPPKGARRHSRHIRLQD